MTLKNFKVQAKTIQNKEFVDGEKKLQWDEIIANILSDTFPDEARSLTGADKFKRAKLAIKIVGEDMDFTVEELAMIKDIIGKYGNTHVVNGVFDILDGK